MNDPLFHMDYSKWSEMKDSPFEMPKIFEPFRMTKPRVRVKAIMVRV